MNPIKISLLSCLCRLRLSGLGILPFLPSAHPLLCAPRSSSRLGRAGETPGGLHQRLVFCPSSADKPRDFLLEPDTEGLACTPALFCLHGIKIKGHLYLKVCTFPPKATSSASLGKRNVPASLHWVPTVARMNWGWGSQSLAGVYTFPEPSTCGGPCHTRLWGLHQTCK